MVWTEVKTKTSPPARMFHAMAYDSARKLTVLFGGQDVQSPPPPYLGGTWEYDGRDWVQRKPAASPTARSGHAMVYDVSRRVVVMFGGRELATGKLLDETWEYNGAAWRLRRLAKRPPVQALHQMVYDSVRRVTVLQVSWKLRSGKRVRSNETWEYNGRSWRQRHLAVALPIGTGMDHGMVYDSARQAVLFVRDGNVWEWSGSKIGWWNRRVTGPPRIWGRIVYDEGRQRTVWYGNSIRGNSVWEWNGTSWRRDPAMFKPGRSWHSMVYDSSRRRVVLFAGAYTWVTPRDTWEYAPTTRGSATQVGAGCAGSAGIPKISADGPPILGNVDFQIRISRARPDSPAFVGLAFKPAALPVGGCTLYLDVSSSQPILVSGWSNGAGVLSIDVPIPVNVALRGFRIETQGFVRDPRGGFFRQLAFTPGLRLKIGD
jgi:hypothetical protein